MIALSDAMICISVTIGGGLGSADTVPFVASVAVRRGWRGLEGPALEDSVGNAISGPMLRTTLTVDFASALTGLAFGFDGVATGTVGAAAGSGGGCGGRGEDMLVPTDTDVRTE